MKPTPALAEYWAMIPDGKERKAHYFSETDQFQRLLNSIANASESELEQIIRTLEKEP